VVPNIGGVNASRATNDPDSGEWDKWLYLWGVLQAEGNEKPFERWFLPVFTTVGGVAQSSWRPKWRVARRSATTITHLPSDINIDRFAQEGRLSPGLSDDSWLPDWMRG